MIYALAEDGKRCSAPGRTDFDRKYLKLLETSSLMEEDLYGRQRRLERLLRESRPLMKDFVAYLRLQALSTARQLRHLENILNFEKRFLRKRLECCGLAEFKKGFDKLILSELDEDTKRIYRTSLRKFYTFLLESRRSRKRTWRRILKFINGVKFRETEPKIEQITEEEFTRMYEAADNDQMRAMLSILYEAGPRSGELLTCCIKDVVIYDDYAELNVTGKTGQGTLILIRSRADLIRHLQSHPLRDYPEAPLWYMWTRRGLRALSYGAFRMRIKRLAEKAGIKRRIWPHLFRHTAATEKASFLTDREMCIAFRWSTNSKMPARYAHLAQRAVKEKILAQYIDGHILEQRKKQRCWRCGEILHEKVKYCPRCGAPTSYSETYDVAVKRREADELMNVLVQHPRVRQVIFEVLKEIYGSDPQQPSSSQGRRRPTSEAADSRPS